MTTAEQVKFIQSSGITQKTLNELMYEITRIKGSLSNAGITTQESTLKVIVNFLQILDGKIDNLFNGGVDKII